MRVKCCNLRCGCQLMTVREVFLPYVAHSATVGQHKPGEVVPSGGRLLFRRHAVGAAEPQAALQGHGPVSDPGKPQPWQLAFRLMTVHSPER